MTPKEAIKRLERFQPKCLCYGSDYLDREAFDLALAALEGKCEGCELAKIPKNREEWSVATQVEADQKMGNYILDFQVK